MKKKEVLGFIASIMVMVIASACSGSNPESDFDVEPLDGGKSIRITGYVGTKWDVRIPSKIRKLPVTHIKANAFSGKKLTSVTIPNSVTTIETRAFAENQLTSVTIPNSVTTIGDSAFYKNQLTSITIPTSVTSIWHGAFANNKLTSVTIPSSVTTIYASTFHGNELTSITIPDSVTTIEANVFLNNPLTSITIGRNVKLASYEDPYLWNPFYGFVDAYEIGGRIAGTYTRPDTDSSEWRKR